MMPLNYIPIPLIFLLTFFVLHPVAIAQAPKSGGVDDAEWLTARSPLQIMPTSVCTRVNIRTLSGQCTSESQTIWGSARRPQFSYTAGASSLHPKTGLPSARDISNIVFDQRGLNTVNAHGLNQLFVFFGQFVDHNMVTTPQDPQERFDIPVPRNDRSLPPGSKMQFLRSMRARVDDSEGGGMDSNNDPVERPLNTLSSPLDLVGVYGAFDMRNFNLRGFNSGGGLSARMKTSPGNLLPLNEAKLVNAPDTSNRFFLAGDHRANEHTVLLAMHTLFVREHNRLVKLIRDSVGNIPGAAVYNAARAMNIAQFQKIVFEQFYPAAVGRDLPAYTGFNPNVNPTISDIFSGAAFRVGHTLVSKTVPRRNAQGNALPEIQMKDLFFRPASEFSPRLMDEVMRGTAHAAAQEVDAWVVDALRNQLFSKVPGEGDFDLIALNLQRGRDHALPSFNEVRRLFGIAPASNFREITRDRSTAARLSSAYRGNVNNVEAFVGLMAEDHEPGSTFGKTMIAIWEAEFTRLRDGDQFLYLRSDRFPALVRNNFKSWIDTVQRPGGVTLADIIVANSAITPDQLPSGDVFKTVKGNIGGSPVPSIQPSTSSITVFARSEGWDDGKSADIQINGKSVFGSKPSFPDAAQKGMNVAVIDEVSGQVLSVRRFNTWLSRAESSGLRRHVRGIPKGRVLAITVMDEASRNLDSETRSVLANRLGSKRIGDLNTRDSWCLITRVGYPEDMLHEAFSKRFDGGVEVMTDALSLPLPAPKPTPIRPTPRRSPTPLVEVSASSAGFDDGNKADIQVNSKSVFGTVAGGPTESRRGMNVAVIDENYGNVLSLEVFDTAESRSANSNFLDFLQEIPKGRILAIAVQENAGRFLSTGTKVFLTELGSKRIGDLEYRDSWCFVTRVGHADKQLEEGFSNRRAGGVEVKLRF